MIEKYNKHGNMQLIVGTTAISKNGEGEYPVRYGSLLSEDLSQLKPGVKIKIEYDPPFVWTIDKPNYLYSLKVLEGGKVEVHIAHHRCPCCWNHALSYNIYNEMVESCLTAESEINESLSEMERNVQDDGGIIYNISLEVATGKYAQLEQAVQAVLFPIFRPIYEFRDRMDEDCKTEFPILVGIIQHKTPSGNRHISITDLFN